MLVEQLNNDWLCNSQICKLFKRKDSDKFTACMASASGQMLPKYLLGEQMGWMNSDAEKMLGSHTLWMSEVKLE